MNNPVNKGDRPEAFKSGEGLVKLKLHTCFFLIKKAV